MKIKHKQNSGFITETASLFLAVYLNYIENNLSQIQMNDSIVSYTVSTMSWAPDLNLHLNCFIFLAVYLNYIENNLSGPESVFGDWTSYTCPFAQTGAFQLTYSESDVLTNQCSGDSKSYATIDGNTILFKACGSTPSSTYS